MDVPAVEAFLGDGDIQASDILDPDLDLLRFSKAQLDDIVLAMFIGLRFDVSLGLPRSLMVSGRSAVAGGRVSRLFCSVLVVHELARSFTKRTRNFSCSDHLSYCD